MMKSTFSAKCIRRWTAETVPVYAEIRCALEKSGTPIGDLDMMIAATAKQGDYILVTNNTNHFKRVLGLKVENWAEFFGPPRDLSRAG